MDEIDPKQRRRARPPRVTISAAPPPVADVMATDPIPQELPAAPAAAPATEDQTMNETIQTAAQTVAQNMADKVQADAKAAFTSTGDNARSAMEKGKKAFEEMNDFARGNIEAMVESTRIAFKGMETMAQGRAVFAKQSFDATAATMKSMVTLTSPTDFLKLQGEHVRSAVDALVAQTSRETEAALKLAGEIAQPIQNRIAIAAEKLKVAA